MSISEYFEQHEEQVFVAKALATAVAIILAKNFLCGLISYLILVFPVLFLLSIRMQAATTRLFRCGRDRIDQLFRGGRRS